VSRLQKQLKSAECEKATLQDQLPKLQDQIACLQRKLAAADATQQQLNEVIIFLPKFSIWTEIYDAMIWRHYHIRLVFVGDQFLLSLSGSLLAS